MPAARVQNQEMHLDEEGSPARVAGTTLLVAVIL